MKKLIIPVIIIIILLIAIKPKENIISIKIPLGEIKKTKELYNIKNDIIEIDENGNITPLKKGITTIKENNKTYKIEVIDQVLDIITNEEIINLDIDEEYEIKYKLKDNITITNYEYDNTIISLNNNKIKALKEGTTILKTITNNGSSKEIKIIVEQKIINLSHKKMNILIGQKIKLSIYSNKKIENIKWNINNDNIKIENQIITGLKKGKSIITINIDGKDYICEVTINDEINEFYLNKNYINLNENEEFIIESNIPLELINFNIKDKSIVSLNNNKIHALKKGKTILTAQSFNKTYYMVIYVGAKELNYNYDYNKFITYFEEVALKNEYINKINSNKIQKWNSPIYYNYINANETDINKIKEIENILNEIPGFPGIYYSKENPNLTINFTTYEYLYGLTKVKGIEGYSTIDFENNKIYKSNIYINENLSETIKNSVIAEEIFHSIGLKNDTKTIKGSILYEYSSTNENPSDYDLLAINLLYGTDINYGMNTEQVKTKLKEILK